MNEKYIVQSAGVNTGLSIAGSLGGENYTCSSILYLYVHFGTSSDGGGTQPQGWEIPMLSTL